MIILLWLSFQEIDSGFGRRRRQRRLRRLQRRQVEKNSYIHHFFSFIKECFDADDDVASEKMKSNILMVSWSDENVTFRKIHEIDEVDFEAAAKLRSFIILFIHLFIHCVERN